MRRMDPEVLRATRDLLSEHPEWREPLRVCLEIFDREGRFDCRGVNNELVYGRHLPRVPNLRPLESRGIIRELAEPPRSRRIRTCSFTDAEAVRTAVAT